MPDTENPILYIEELRRLPLRPRRLPVPGAVHVYRGRDGRLSTPPGGDTAGELWWRGPRVSYEVDTSRHAVAVSLPVDNAHGVRATVEVVGQWRVHDPRAVVAHRINDATRVFWVTLRGRLGPAVDDATSHAELVAVVRRLLPGELWLPEGLRYEEIAARVLAGTPDERLMRELLSDDDALAGAGGGDADLLATWQHYRQLADAGLRAAAAREEIPAEERESLVGSALQRFSALVARLGDHLPAGPERDG